GNRERREARDGEAADEGGAPATARITTESASIEELLLQPRDEAVIGSRPGRPQPRLHLGVYGETLTLALIHRCSIRMRRRISDAVVAILTIALLGFAATPASAAPHPLRLGFLDSSFESPNAGVRDFWLDKSKAIGGTLVRMEAGWSGIAAQQPANPTNPGDPAYNWANLDAAVRDAAARGLSPLLSFNSAPAWAEGPGRDPNAKFGTWRPNASAFGAFARAAAKRYSGTFPDPLNI